MLIWRSLAMTARMSGSQPLCRHGKGIDDARSRRPITGYWCCWCSGRARHSSLTGAGTGPCRRQSHQATGAVSQSSVLLVILRNIRIVSLLERGDWRDRVQGRALSEIRLPARCAFLCPLFGRVPRSQRNSERTGRQCRSCHAQRWAVKFAPLSATGPDAEAIHHKFLADGRNLHQG